MYTGTLGSLNQLACNDNSGSLQSFVRFDAVAGQTYYLMVGSFASGPGGMLKFSIDVAPPQLVIDLGIDQFGRFVPQTGEAEVSGTLTCSEPASAQVFGILRQEVGRRFVIQGFFSVSFDCEGKTAWSAPVTPDAGRFAGGPAKVTDTSALAVDSETGESVQDEALARIVLRGRRK